jgi:hypothetical protein
VAEEVLQFRTEFRYQVCADGKAKVLATAAHPIFEKTVTIRVPKQGNDAAGVGSGNHRKIEARLPGIVLREKRPEYGVRQTVTASLAVAAHVARIIAQSSGRAFLHGSLYREGGKKITGALAVALQSLPPFRRIFLELRSAGRCERHEIKSGRKKGLMQIVVPTLA